MQTKQRAGNQSDYAILLGNVRLIVYVVTRSVQTISVTNGYMHMHNVLYSCLGCNKMFRNLVVLQS